MDLSHKMISVQLKLTAAQSKVDGHTLRRNTILVNVKDSYFGVASCFHLPCFVAKDDFVLAEAISFTAVSIKIINKGCLKHVFVINFRTGDIKEEI